MMFAIYDLKTGIISSHIELDYVTNINNVIPETSSVIQGEYDALSQKVDITTGLVVDYQPDSPGENYVWDSDKKRWAYEKTDTDLAWEVRAKRDKLLADADWVTLRAMRTQIPIPQEWLDYQSALADLPAQPGFPRTITWPTAPSN